MKVWKPVISEGLCILPVKCTRCGKHDGGVKISNDASHSTGSCDTCLGTTVTGLQRSQHMRHLKPRARETVLILDIINTLIM